MPENNDLAYRQALATEYSALPTQLLVSGDKYETGHLFEGVADGNTKSVVLENNYSDQALLTLEPTVKSSGQFFVNKTRNPSIDTAGTELGTINPKTDATNTPSVTATTAGDNETGVISGGTDYAETTAGSGSNTGNASPGESGTAAITDIIMPTDTLAVTASNQSGSTQDMSIVIDFVVFPTAEFDNLRY